MSEVRVWVIQRGDRPGLVLVWNDPITGRRRQRAAKSNKRKDADREAGTLAEKLAKEVRTESIAWDIARARYEQEVLSLQRRKSLKSFRTAANRFEGVIAPEQLSDSTADRLSRFTAELHQAGLSSNSIGSYLRELRRFLRWAAEIWPSFAAPRVRVPRVPKRDLMKGRPITTEEFERMLSKAAVGMVDYLHSHWQHQPKPARRKSKPREWISPSIPQAAVDSWTFFLRGLWESGLRLGEALTLSWDVGDHLHVYGIDQRKPGLRYFAESEKGNRDRLLPITPGFARFLWSVPAEQRHGPVFCPVLTGGRVQTMEIASAVICAIGKVAGVVVSTNRRGQPKYASAQDFRRSFGSRLAHLVHPMQLKELMRHASLETTMRYYVGIEYARLASDIWEAIEGHSCDQSCDSHRKKSNDSTRRKSKLPKSIEKELGY